MSGETDESALDQLLLDQLALVFAHAALENFLREQQASDSLDESKGTAACELGSGAGAGGKIDGQLRRR